MQLIRYNIPYQPQISILRIPRGMQQLTDSGNLKHKDISILRIPCGMQPIIAVQFRFALQFSILRTPHGMQRCQSRPKSTPPLFQSYASLAGCNHRIVTFDIGNINFNLTHPLRDATQQHPPQTGERHISILRIPCGMQLSVMDLPWSYHVFQSYASLAGCNPAGPSPMNAHKIFQSYASLAGCNW